MSRRRRRLFYRRTFLNRPHHHGLAAVVASVELLPVKDGGLEIEADLEIADCTRTVNLAFSIWDGRDVSDVANALHKARLLRTVVSGFVDALEEAVEEMRAAQAAVPAGKVDTGARAEA